MTIGVAALAGAAILLVPRFYEDDDNQSGRWSPFPVTITVDQEPSTPDPRTFLPPDLQLPTNLTFCEPLLNASKQIAVVSTGEVAYSNGTCGPGVDAEGRVTVRTANGSLALVVPDYTAPDAAFRDDIVWIPATGVLDGRAIVFGAAYIETAKVIYDTFGNPLVQLNVEPGDGQAIMQSLTERIVGYPLAMFIGTHPVMGGDGSVIAPVVQSPITDVLVTSGLTDSDVKRLVELFDAGQLR